MDGTGLGCSEETDGLRVPILSPSPGERQCVGSWGRPKAEHGPVCVWDIILEVSMHKPGASDVQGM